MSKISSASYGLGVYIAVKNLIGLVFYVILVYIIVKDKVNRKRILNAFLVLLTGNMLWIVSIFITIFYALIHGELSDLVCQIGGACLIFAVVTNVTGHFLMVSERYCQIILERNMKDIEFWGILCNFILSVCFFIYLFYGKFIPMESGLYCYKAYANNNDEKIILYTMNVLQMLVPTFIFYVYASIYFKVYRVTKDVKNLLEVEPSTKYVPTESVHKSKRDVISEYSNAVNPPKSEIRRNAKREKDVFMTCIILFTCFMTGIGIICAGYMYRTFTNRAVPEWFELTALFVYDLDLLVTPLIMLYKVKSLSTYFRRMFNV
jgi:hypothetical protein